MACVRVGAILCIGEAWAEGHQRVLGSDVQVVVHTPVRLPHLACRVEQALCVWNGGGGGGGEEQTKTQGGEKGYV